ncbi:hypothetical protein GCM10009127_04980 [Alteraurantiacibacter aestuarii]|uniref:Uncharacterized protein n=1 Tax=Alteraurantiacibacter aestuarii TaxID=650004 RepID=A0A844ZLR8_9SPHN|nr:hypothetical protein [Alteraurantiacibacter aestuarii]MXO88252.1 hypothetical protein [Alteraurantiacibacter aestuarii]
MPEVTENDDQIVVRGGRPPNVTREDVHRQARDIADSGDQLDTPLARFEDRLCPGIIGLQEEYASMMIDRIRQNAVDLGVRVLPDNCTPNMLVIFSTDSLATMQNMVDRNPYIFQYMQPEERRALLQPAPVHVFANVELRTRDGMPVGRVRSLTEAPVVRAQMAHSRIYTPTRRDIASIMVIFDRDEVGGMSVMQLADYATMRGLAQTKPVDGLAMRSILSLFEPVGPYPESLTDFDRAYLRALYEWIPNLPAAAKLGNVNRQLRLMAEEE